MPDIKYKIFKEDSERNQTLLESFDTPEEAYHYTETHNFSPDNDKPAEKLIIKECIDWEHN